VAAAECEIEKPCNAGALQGFHGVIAISRRRPFVELLTAAGWGGRRHFDIYIRAIATASRSRETTEDKQKNAAKEQGSHDDAEDSRGAAGIVCHLISPPISFGTIKYPPQYRFRSIRHIQETVRNLSAYTCGTKYLQKACWKNRR
jgi:hypothetical protein